MNIKDALHIAGIAVDYLPVLSHLAGVGDAKSIATIRAIVSTLEEGLAGKTTPEIVLAQLQSLTDGIKADDAALAAAADQKYGAME